MFRYFHNDQTYSVQLERLPDGTYRATIEGRTYHVRADTTDTGLLLAFPDSGAQITAYILSEGDTHSIHVDGETFTLTRASQRKERRATSVGAHSGDVSAQMPGQVREVLVSQGDIVTKGQALIILEAMKMEVRATAPADGSVKQVLVAAGEVVKRGQVLVIVEPTP